MGVNQSTYHDKYNLAFRQEYYDLSKHLINNWL